MCVILVFNFFKFASDIYSYILNFEYESTRHYISFVWLVLLLFPLVIPGHFLLLAWFLFYIVVWVHYITVLYQDW